MTTAEQMTQDLLAELADRLEAIQAMLISDASVVQRTADRLRKGEDAAEDVPALDDLVRRHMLAADAIGSLGDHGLLGRTVSARVSDVAREGPRRRG